VGVVQAGQDPDANQLALGSDLLNMALKALQNEGIMLSKLERTTTTLVAGQAQYATDASTLDIDGGTPYVTNSLGVDIPLVMISRAQYMELTLKSVQSQPTQMYVEKGTSVSFFLYPIPDGNWVSVTYPRIKLLTDMDSGGVTTGLPSKYLDTVTLLVASRLAFHHGLLDKQRALKAEFEEAKARAINDDTERGNVKFVPSYGLRSFTRY
jgi:hypothetical protein